MSPSETIFKQFEDRYDRQVAWLADEKDAVKDSVTQDAEYLTSRCNGLHFGGRRRDRGRFSNQTTLPAHTCTQSQRAWLPHCFITGARFFFLRKKKKIWATTLSNFPVYEILTVRTASTLIPFLNQHINQKGRGKHMHCLVNSMFSKKPCRCFEID